MPLYTIDDRRVLFVHIPKTGGVSISNWLGRMGEVSFHGLLRSPTFRCTPQHFTMSDFLFLFDRSSWDYAFTIVRDPYDRVESEYFWRAQIARSANIPHPTFDKWLASSLDYFQRDKLYMDNHFRQQTDFLDDGLTIFRFENGLPTIANRISEICGFNVPFENVALNASQREPVQWRLSSIIEFNKVYQFDFDALAYRRKDARPKDIEILT